MPGQVGTQPPELRLTGTAVFHGDRLVGWLDDETTRGLLWVRNQILTATVTVEVDGKELTSTLVHSTTRLKPEKRDGRLVMVIEATTVDDLEENGAGIDLSDPKTLKRLEQKLNQAIAERILDAVKAAQKKYKSDILGFGQAIHRSFPKDWKRLKDRWEEEFPQLPVEVRVKSIIRRTGLITKPLIDEEKIRRAR